jgi:MarR family transcriptional regulator, lower aerobic nicotinate degradation pathway regulator
MEAPVHGGASQIRWNRGVTVSEGRSEGLLSAALRRRPSFALIRLAALARQHCVDVLVSACLSQHQHAILCCLDEFGPSVQKDVATRLGLDAGDIVAFVDGLQAAGLLTRERDPRDRRRQILSITDEGRRVLLRVEEMFDAAEPGALAALTARQRSDLHRMATQVLAAHAPKAWSEGG